MTIKVVVGRALAFTAVSAVAVPTLAAPAAVAASTGGSETVQAAMFTRGPSRIFVSNDTSSSGIAEFDYVTNRSHTALIAGDWDGDGKDSLAYHDSYEILIKDTMEGGEPDCTVVTHSPNSELVSGDFNNDGIDDLARRDGNKFTINTQLRNPIEGLSELSYGRAGDELFVGDWDGDGLSTFAVRRGNLFYIKNDVTPGNADKVIAYGRVGDEVLVGDWDGDGVDTFAVRRGNQYFIKDDVTSGNADRVIAYGRAGDLVVVGDWNGDKKDSFVVRRDVPPPPSIERPTGPIIGASAGNDGPFLYFFPGDYSPNERRESRPDSAGNLPPVNPEFEQRGFYTIGARCKSWEQSKIYFMFDIGDRDEYDTTYMCHDTWWYDVGKTF